MKNVNTNKASKMRWIGIIALVAIIGLTIAACGGGGSNLNGTWATADGNASYTFAGNKVTVQRGTTTIEGTIEIKDGNLLMTLDGAGETNSYAYKIENDTLTLPVTSTYSIVLTKVKK